MNLCILTLYFVLISALKRSLPKHLLEDNCISGHKYMSVGDFWLSDANYTKVQQQEKRFLVIATHKGCLSCCHHEITFSRLQIKIGRLEMADNIDFLQKYQIKRFPFILLFHGENTFYYNDLIDYDRLVEFISRFNVDEVTYVNKYNAQEINKNQLNIIGIFYYQREQAQEILKFKEFAKTVIMRNYRAQFYILNDKKQIKMLKSQHSLNWFQEYSLSSIVVMRAHKEYVIEVNSTFPVILQRQALSLIDEFTMINYPFYIAHKLPILTLVIDSIYKTNDSLAYLSFFKDIAIEFMDHILVNWIEGSLNPDKTKMLGLEGRQYDKPSLAFFHLDSDIKVVFTDEIYDKDRIRQFIQSYLNKTPLQAPPKQAPQQTLNTKSQMLKNLIKNQKLQLVEDKNLANQKPFTLLFCVSSLSETFIEYIKFIERRFKLFNQVIDIRLFVEVEVKESVRLYIDKTLVTVNWNDANTLLQYVELVSGRNYTFPPDAGINEEELYDYYINNIF